MNSNLAIGSTLLSVVAVVALAACGSADPAPTTTREVETAEALPELPRGWNPYINRAAGFTLGRPPGWAASEDGSATLFRSPDELVAMTISADRTDEALALPLARYATRTALALPGLKDVDLREPETFKGHYEGVSVKGNGRLIKSKLLERLQVIVLRRNGIVTITAVIAANAGEAQLNSNVEAGPDCGTYPILCRVRAEVDQAIEAVRTLRSRPVSAPAG